METGLLDVWIRSKIVCSTCELRLDDKGFFPFKSRCVFGGAHACVKGVTPSYMHVYQDRDTISVKEYCSKQTDHSPKRIFPLAQREKDLLIQCHCCTIFYLQKGTIK